VPAGYETLALVQAVVAAFQRLCETSAAFRGGAARAAEVRGEANTTLVTVLAFGDDAFAAVKTVLQSLGLINVLAEEDPQTGLDAVFVPHGRPAPQRDHHG